jgi:hypothetical protein
MLPLLVEDASSSLKTVRISLAQGHFLHLCHLLALMISLRPLGAL